MALFTQEPGQLSWYSDCATGWTTEEPWFDSRQEQERDLCLFQHVNTGSVAHLISLLLNRYWGLFLRVHSSHSVRLTIYHHLVPWLRMNGVTNQLNSTHAPSWRAQELHLRPLHFMKI
jgi:hypothetical protein